MERPLLGLLDMRACLQDWERFSVNASGSLKSNAPFDFERKPLHELKILACHQANCSSVHVFISVVDRNDNCPTFPRQVSFHISASIFTSHRFQLCTISHSLYPTSFFK